jgi:hypothetical protein
MRSKLLHIVSFIMLVPACTFAQDLNDKKAWGYLFGGFGGASQGEGAFVHVGGGAEGLMYRAVGIGAELGYLTPSTFRNGIGLFSLDFSAHFNSSGKTVPFVTGGYSLAFRSGTASGGNFGGGMNYWFSNRAALRVEFRDQVFSSDSPHTYVLRVGVSLR